MSSVEGARRSGGWVERVRDYGAGRLATAGAAGALFGFGLIRAGMTDPSRVLAFLDFTGDWNPALALVMASAVAVAAPAFALARHRRRSLLGAPIHIPDRFRIDRRLVTGAAVFGLGWGLTGICPGPGLMLLATGTLQGLLFIGGLTLGMILAARWPSRDAED